MQHAGAVECVRLAPSGPARVAPAGDDDCRYCHVDIHDHLDQHVHVHVHVHVHDADDEDR